jgi:hypothetical protein
MPKLAARPEIEKRNRCRHRPNAPLPVSHIYPRAALDAGFSDYKDAIAAKRTDSLAAVSCQSLLLFREELPSLCD